MTTPDGRKRFPILSKVALLVLTIPHSNAGEERVSSMIKKNLTLPSITFTVKVLLTCVLYCDAGPGCD